MNEQSKILKWIIISSSNSIIYGAILFFIGNQNINLALQLWGLLPYVVLAIIAIKFEIFFRAHVFQNRFHRVIYWFCLVLQFVLGALPSFNVFYAQPPTYALMLIGQIIITVVVIKLWEQISQKTVLISNNKMHERVKLSDEIEENSAILLENQNSYKKNVIVATMWMGLATIVVIFLYTIIPFVFSIFRFHNKYIAVISLITYLLFMYLNHQKNAVFYTEKKAAKLNFVEELSILAGLCLTNYFALTGDGPGSINFIVIILAGVSLCPFLYNNRKLAEAYNKSRKI
jgi:hypothetical protein